MVHKLASGWMPIFGGAAPTFGEDETLGYFFAEATASYILPSGLKATFGVGLQQAEDFSVMVPGQFGDARFDIDNDLDMTLSGEISIPIGLRYASYRRLKRNIRHVATRRDGLRLYAFEYLWGDETHVRRHGPGSIAQRDWRAAVSTMANGYYAVDYRRFGLRMTTLKTWQAESL